MAKNSRFRAAARVRPDAKGRVTLGSRAKGVSSFRVEVDEQGRILLDPFVEVPARERWLFENREALDRVRRGLADAEAERTNSLGSFARKGSGKRRGH